MDDKVRAIRDHGWRQGSIFPSTATNRLSEALGAKVLPDDCCVVVSQSCDIVHDDFDAEPSVEIVLARRLPEGATKDGNFLYAKNARRLQFDVALGHGLAATYDAAARDRFNIDRLILADNAPDQSRSLDGEALDILIRWIIARFSRTAFPDEFNQRLTPRAKKISKILARLHQVESILVALNSWDELPEGSDYQLHLIGVVQAKDTEAHDARAKLEAELGKLAECLNGCSGIAVLDYEIRPDTDVSLADARALARWYLDSISLRHPSDHTLPELPS